MSTYRNHPPREQCGRHLIDLLVLGEELGLETVDDKLTFAAFEFGTQMAAQVFAQHRVDPKLAGREEGYWKVFAIYAASTAPAIDTARREVDFLDWVMISYRARLSAMIAGDAMNGAPT